MTTSRTLARAWPAIVAGAFFTAGSLQAQSLTQRVANAPDGRMQFTFASRDGVCGDGRTFMRMTFSSGTINEIHGSISGDAAQMCERGPVRVVLETAARTVTRLRVYAGPMSSTEGITNLGTVSARDAADYLLSLAATAEGSVARDAIMPAMLVDSVDAQARLIALARDGTRSRETRRSAITWLGRTTSSPSTAAQALIAIVNNNDDNQSVRQSALRTLARLEGGAGVPEVIRLASDREGGWVSREALTVLAGSGDPRAREFLRQVVRRAELPDEALATAIRSFGRDFATAADIQLIRDAWSRLPGPKSQGAAVSAVAEFGGAENAKWLIGLVRDPAIAQTTRVSVLRSAVRSGAKVADLVAIYNGTVDYQMKNAIISALGESGEREATDKLLAIAKADDSTNARRRAISVLSKSSDPRVRKELEAIALKR